MTTFYLGTHMPHWLGLVDTPFMVSRNRLIDYKTLPRALGSWMLDSGGFTELRDHGGWRIGPSQYAAEVRRFRDEVGCMVWAAPQDWMCESSMLARTGLDVAEHQRRTVVNLLELRDMAPDLPFIPVLQGSTLDDYLRCLDLYFAVGINLLDEPLVGVGSVCRRQATAEIEAIMALLAGFGMRLHGFGVKTLGLARYGQYLASADSLAWSYDGRRIGHACEHGSRAKNEANCLPFALEWRERVLRAVDVSLAAG